jgi:hypothetical protein
VATPANTTAEEKAQRPVFSSAPTPPAGQPEGDR